MPAGLISAVIDAIKNGPEGREYASLTMAGLDPRDASKIFEGPNVNVNFQERALQYWPETITDSIETGWNFKNVGGGSGALAQWASNGGRTISFNVELSRLMAPVSSRTSARDKFRGGFTEPNDMDKINNAFNVDIVEYIKFLRAFCYPTYEALGGAISSYPPPIMILCIPGIGLNEAINDDYGEDCIYCVMTGCDVTYTLLFPNGTPRRATVALTLRQVIQTSTGIRFAGFGQAAQRKYNGSTSAISENLDVNAGRSLNKIMSK
jgi:hypothetical protein